MKRECETCIKRKTPYCPTSIDCMATDDMPYYQNRIMLLEENKELKKQLRAETISHDYDKRIVEKHCEFVDKHYEQQKRFTKYLEEYINEEENSSKHDCVFTDAEVKDIVVGILCFVLSKYKEIIGEIK